MSISRLINLPKWMADKNYQPQPNCIDISWLVFISCPDHMQITPDNEGYWSIRYSKSTYSTNMAAGNLGQGHSY